jgi:hypothetical protein
VAFGDIEITQSPLLDAHCGLAHLTYAQALAVARDNGARLPTRDEVLRLHEVAAANGTELEPFTLPDRAMAAEGAKPGDPAMVTWEWCARHDAVVTPQIRRIVPTSDAPIANAGKHWIGPAPDGLAALCGWWSNGAFIQSGLGCPHNDQHSDYATTTVLVRAPR